MSTLRNLQKLHEPVLVNEVLEAFGLNSVDLAHSKKRLKIIDATAGLGGHTEEFVRRGVQVLAIDEDGQMLEVAEKRLKLACPTPESNFQGSYTLIKGNFKDIFDIAKDNDFLNADGILFDLGVSSPQITSTDRGFSFQDDKARLDMRRDQVNMSVTGSDILNILREDQLREMFAQVMNLKLSRRLTKEVINHRRYKKIETVGDFKKIINKVIFRKGKKSTETLPFLALRIAVNSEIHNLREGLIGAIKVLGNLGKMVVISFHSDEDKVVVEMFNKFESDGLGSRVNKIPIVPSPTEINKNIRSRSALMRIFELK